METQTISVAELVEVLRDELASHHKLLQLEMSKREAIIARDGELLKQAAAAQAQELHKIDLLESRRERLARGILHSEDDLRLARIIESSAVSAPEKKELGRYQAALQSALGELRKISEVNGRMLIDSRDLFKTMLSSLTARNPHHEHGSVPGSLARGMSSRPMLVDANC